MICFLKKDSSCALGDIMLLLKSFTIFSKFSYSNSSFPSTSTPSMTSLQYVIALAGDLGSAGCNPLLKSSSANFYWLFKYLVIHLLLSILLIGHTCDSEKIRKLFSWAPFSASLIDISWNFFKAGVISIPFWSDFCFGNHSLLSFPKK